MMGLVKGLEIRCLAIPALVVKRLEGEEALIDAGGCGQAHFAGPGA